MASSSFTRAYPRTDFLALTGAIPLALLRTRLGALTLTVPLVDVRFTPTGDTVIVEWYSFPLPTDVVAVDASIATFAGGTTSRAPIEVNSFAAATAITGVAVTKVDVTTPPLEAGTYQVIWNSKIRMQAVIANTGVEAKMKITRSDGVYVEQDDAWDLANNHAYNGAITFTVLAGQTIQALLTFSRLGIAGIAEMSGARVTIDRMSSGQA